MFKRQTPEIISTEGDDILMFSDKDVNFQTEKVSIPTEGEAERDQQNQTEKVSITTEGEEVTKVPRKRGRPKKIVQETNNTESEKEELKTSVVHFSK